MHDPFFTIDLELDIVHKPEDGSEFCVKVAFFNGNEGGALHPENNPLDALLRCLGRTAVVKGSNSSVPEGQVSTVPSWPSLQNRLKLTIQRWSLILPYIALQGFVLHLTDRSSRGTIAGKPHKVVPLS